VTGPKCFPKTPLSGEYTLAGLAFFLISERRVLAVYLDGKIVIGRNAGIKITHGAILKVFAPQGPHVPPIMTKFGTSKETDNPLRRVKFYVDRSIYGEF